ncbi:unnamed protein product [Brassica oleracea]|uniref:(rape) hypothetical protein n=1 Tax=Brassica napus TaxID=3708 RepID=A0A816JP81_BRANA|nr:unnamed protein product [Brassica napus]
MDAREINGSTSTARSLSLPKHPDYSSKLVQEALRHLASINLRELCNEAKVERCRATRDLASCGRSASYVLIPCGHASLCTECSQRCDVCPICRSSLLRTGDRLRLYYECVEAAVSSDPVIAFLLDEVVVKDWVKRTFLSILAELQHICILLTAGIIMFLKQVYMCAQKFMFLLAIRAKLRENIGKTKQHLDIMIWCIRHRFLEDVRSRYSDSTLWKALVLERKSNVIKRAWPEAVDQSSDCNVQEYSQDIAADLEVGYLQNDKRSFLRSRLEGNSGSYPFENLQTAADILFLHGSSDLVVAKQAIFMYYLFDRHWTTPEKYWKHILDDFATTFSITRHSLMESFVFAQAKCITVNAAYFLENLSSIYSWPFWSAFEWNLLVVCMGATLPLHPGIPS